MKNEKIAVVIPAYNEAKVIRTIIAGLHKYLTQQKYNFEVIVVDDGSVDGTSSEARSAGAFVITHILNSGSGSATATGLSYTQQNNFTLVATMDADGQHTPEDLARGLNEIRKGGDLLIGSRLLGSKGMSTTKVIGNKGLSYFTYFLFGVKVTDSQSGMRIFSKKAIDQLRWKTSGYEFCSEMLWRAKQIGLVIREYPIEAIYTDYSIAKGQNNWNSINIIKSLINRRLMELFE